MKRSEVADFKARTLPKARQGLIVRHLVAECPVCKQRLREGVRRMAVRAGDEIAYEAAIDRALERAQQQWSAVAEQIRQGRELWEELRALPAGRRLTLVQSSRRHCTAFVLQAILEDYRGGAWRRPEEGLELGRLAAAVVRRLDAESTAPWLLADLRAETLAVAGNACCLAALFEEARELLAEAAAYVRRGTGDPMVRALVLGYQGGYELARRRFRAAERLLARAEQAYRRVDQLHLAVQMLVQRARAIGPLHPGEGVRLTRRALAEMESEVEPGLELEAVHQLAWCLCDAGEADEARRVIERHGELYLRSGAMASFSRSWLLGRIHRARGETADAERFYGRAWAGFHEIGARLQLTMLALDIAEVRAAVGDLDGAASSLAETVALAQGWGLEDEGLRILHLLCREVAGGGGGRVVFRRAAVALRRGWP